MQIFNFTLIFVSLFFSIHGLLNLRYFPRYHIAPPGGWMNDPNGLCKLKNLFHLFYQYNPNSSYEAGIAHWGHAISEDLFHWKHLPIAMYPDQVYDRTGVFSGSALIENDTMYLIYTGNVNHPGESPDHEQHQALAISTDGLNVTKYKDNPIINGTEHQPNIRDPKVWKHLDNYYLVLGNSFNNNTLGRVLLYKSDDKISWTQISVLGESDGFLGYMWECPDFFELDGQFILLFSPQGVKADGDKYNNLYQTGYFTGDFNYTDYTYTPLTEFEELDHGHDFYATQTTFDESGRRILLAWFDMWDQNYPEQADGFNGQMTLPRVLSLSKDGRLLQKPVEEIYTARDEVLYTDLSCSGGTTVRLDDNAAEINITASNSKNFDLYIESQTSDNTTVHIKYDSEGNRLSLDRGGEDGLRRTRFNPDCSFTLNIYIDASSIEIFAGEGEVTFSSRFFPDGLVQIRVGDNSTVEYMGVTKMKRTVFV